jgi:hypothetical protein
VFQTVKKPAKSVRHLIETEHSRQNVNRVIKSVGTDQKRFDELMNIYLGTDEELARRAAWSVGFIVQDHPHLVKKWFPKLIANLGKAGQHPAIYRNTFRFMQVIEIPEKYSAPILDAAYRYVLDASNAAAVRAFALTTAFNIVRKYRELAPELRLVAQQVIQEESKAMISRGNRTLRDLDKLK